jgi:sulfoxide reductase heme-binding subunit YedZ
MKRTRLDGRSFSDPLRGWALFWLLATLVSIVELIAWHTIDMRSPEDVQLLIGFNWRLATPYFLLTFSASSLQRLFPSASARWMLTNRRYLGLAFATVCGWQLATIAMLGWRFPDVLAQFHSNSFQFVEDVAFTIIALMTLTSFNAISRRIGLTAWRRLHKTGIYVLAALFTVNHVNVVMHAPDFEHIAFAMAFAAAWLLRGAVWWQRRRIFLHGWALFWAMSALVNAVVLVTWAFHNLRSDQNVGLMIRLSTGCAAIAFLIAFCAPPLQRLFPSAVAGWLFANRRYFLLTFALGFGWHVIFSVYRLVEFPKYFSILFPLPPDMATAITWLGDAVLVIMVLVSFQGVGRYLSATALGLMRRCTTYLLAGLFIFSYFMNRSDGLHAAFLVVFTLAWFLQIVAWRWPQSSPEFRSERAR